MKPEIWIDGKRVKFTTAYVLLTKEGTHERIQIPLRAGSSDTVRVGLVDGGDIVTETPLTYDRWKRIAREG